MSTADELLSQLPEQSRPVIDDKRRVIIDELPISGMQVIMNPPKALHLDNLETFVLEAQKSNKTLTNLQVMFKMVTQLQDNPMTKDEFFNLDTEDVEVLGLALTMFPAYSNLRSK